MANNLILTKESSESEIKAYFDAVLKLSQSDNEFPINFDEVWMLVYQDKRSAIFELKDKFIQDVDFQMVRRKVQASNVAGFVWADTYYFTVSCMEFFIARKVRPVFEVYRRVFHKAADSTQRPLTQAEFLLKMAQLNLENERKVRELESKQDRLQEKVDEIEQRTTTDLKISTVVAYVSRNMIPLDISKYSAIGKKASNICKQRGLVINKIHDVRWGNVNVYPDEVLDEIFNINN